MVWLSGDDIKYSQPHAKFLKAVAAKVLPQVIIVEQNAFPMKGARKRLKQ